jgi:predicted ribosomally synthesized peptide with nif11-like leader
MSQADAVAFLERVESDEEFAKELESQKDDPNAVVEKVHAAGFEATPDEIREAFLERYGAELTPEQLDQIAGGLTSVEEIGIGAGIGGVVGLGLAAAALAGL